MWPFRRKNRDIEQLIERAMQGLPPDPITWAEEVFKDPGHLQRLSISFERMNREEAWKFYRAMLRRKIDLLSRELRHAPKPGERDRSNEIRAVISVLESLLAIPAEVEIHARSGLRAIAWAAERKGLNFAEGK